VPPPTATETRRSGPTPWARRIAVSIAVICLTCIGSAVFALPVIIDQQRSEMAATTAVPQGTTPTAQPPTLEPATMIEPAPAPEDVADTVVVAGSIPDAWRGTDCAWLTREQVAAGNIPQKCIDLAGGLLPSGGGDVAQQVAGSSSIDPAVASALDTELLRSDVERQIAVNRAEADAAARIAQAKADIEIAAAQASAERWRKLGDALFWVAVIAANVALVRVVGPGLVRWFVAGFRFHQAEPEPPAAPAMSERLAEMPVNIGGSQASPIPGVTWEQVGKILHRWQQGESQRAIEAAVIGHAAGDAHGKVKDVLVFYGCLPPTPPPAQMLPNDSATTP
jgi:hypothetical protein